MRTYRDRATWTRLSTPALSAMEDQQPLPPQEDPESWYSMDSQYGLSNMEIIQEENKEEVSIDEEYMLYTTAPVVRSVTNLLSYWQVWIVVFYTHGFLTAGHGNTDVPGPIPDLFRDGDGLLTHPSISCALRAGLFLRS